MLELASEPGAHKYVEAPKAFNVVLCPSQIIGFIATALTIGKELTFTLTWLKFAQPLTSVPVTVNVCGLVGLTEILVPLKPPGNQVYVFAPAPINVVD